MSHVRRAPRVGFTLVELLVVIAIIAVLMGLLMSGVMAVLAAMDRSANKTDLGLADQSLQTAFQQYGNCKTLPGKLVLCNNMGAYNPNAAPPNGIYAVFPHARHLALRVRLWIDFLKHSYGDARYWSRTPGA